jgi:toxin YhaV
MVRNEWTILCHRLFQVALDDLISKVQNEQKKDPSGYKSKEAYKLLARVLNLILDEIPGNPSHPKYSAGATHDKPYRDWKRAKPAQQYRLFFKYSSQNKRIIYAWLNDIYTLRAYGSNTDAYKTFMKLLSRGQIPNGTDGLIKESRCPKIPTGLP